VDLLDESQEPELHGEYFVNQNAKDDLFYQVWYRLAWAPGRWERGRSLELKQDWNRQPVDSRCHDMHGVPAEY